MKSKALTIISICAVTMVVSMCSSREPAKTTTGELRITNLVFCSEAPEDYMKYKEQPNATYKPGDVVWIYMNLNYD